MTDTVSVSGETAIIVWLQKQTLLILTASEVYVLKKMFIIALALVLINKLPNPPKLLESSSNITTTMIIATTTIKSPSMKTNEINRK